LPFVRVSLDVVFQLIKAELKQWLIGQCSLWGYDKRWPENIAKKDDQKTLQRKMIRKHGCFVSTALRRVGRWRRRRSLDSISTNIHSRIQLASPLFFWLRDRLRLRFSFLNRYSQKFIELEKQKCLMLILMLILATESRGMELTIAPII